MTIFACYNYSVRSIAVLLIHVLNLTMGSGILPQKILQNLVQNPAILEVNGLAYRGPQLCHNKRGKLH